MHDISAFFDFTNHPVESTLICFMMGLALFLIICLVRAVKGPKACDRLVAVNMMGSITMVIIACLCVVLDEGFLADICLIYSLLSFLAVVLFAKVKIGIYRQELEREEAVLEQESIDILVKENTEGKNGNA
ncbi:MAG: sodium:proton antiporter [Lachnospiraceae bacterium]|nr:sodium:proton antiporter [Lachnospiraceae bacterium]